jgi:hypothetical protein
MPIRLLDFRGDDELRAFLNPLYLRKDTDDATPYNLQVSRLIIDNANTYIDNSGSDMTFTDPTTGTKTLAQLAAGGGGAVALPDLTDVDNGLLYTNHFIFQADGSQYTASTYSHAWLDDIGTNTHTDIDTHISTDHVNTFNARTGDVIPLANDYTWGDIDKTVSDIDDITTKSHTSLTDIGTNTHSDIDTHIADTTIHPTDTLLVHLAGSETITGLKTFNTVLPQSSLVPSAGNDFINKTYADALASGFNFKEASKVATTTALPACTYDNGSGGVGATLTGNSNGSLGNIDGYPVALNDRLLVKDQVLQEHNGIYKKTQVGDAGQPWILTRATDFDTDAEINEGSSCLITQGTVNGATQWAQSTPDPITVGTTDLVFIQISAPLQYTASNGVLLSVRDFQIDLSDTNPSLEVADGGLRVKDDESSIERSTSGLRVKASGITNTMLAGSIADSKLNTISSSGKVQGDALTLLNNTPSGAGVIPIANLATGTPNGTKYIRDDGTLQVPPGGGGGVVETIVPGTNITVDDSDPANPIVSSTYTNVTPYAEVPSGLVNGVNVTFTLAHTPTYEANVVIQLDGGTQYNGVDYTVSGDTITFSVAPATGSTIFAYYGSTNNVAAQFSGLSLITVGITQPTDPSVGDIWIDTN